MAMAGASLSALGCNGCSSAIRAHKSKPNFLFVLTDDQRFDAMGFMGHPFLETSNIDRILTGLILTTRNILERLQCEPRTGNL